MGRDGFTLIEVLAACALLTAALAMIWGAWLSAGDTFQAVERKIAATESSAAAMARIAGELRHASRQSVTGLPGVEVRYRHPTDRDGNGLPIDASGAPEWGDERRMGPDYDDLNGDGLRDTQLILQHGGEVAVLANGLAAGEGDPGIWFEFHHDSVGVTLRVQRTTQRRGLVLPAVAAQHVTPRNP